MGVLAQGDVPLGDGTVVHWAFTDRTGGVSIAPYDEANLALHVEDDPAHVAANRAALAASLGLPPSALVTMTQVHGRDVAAVDATSPAGPPPVADALITDALDLALITQVADCVPILLAGPRGTIAAVHCGWRGVVAGIVDSAVDAFVQRGVAPASLRAWIGPAICADCYEVGADVRDQVAATAPSAFAVRPSGTPSVDVRAGVGEQLARHGIAAQSVEACTAHDDRLFSYRRDGRTGRQAGVIVRRVAHP